jgi:hypothetical protein
MLVKAFRPEYLWHRVPKRQHNLQIMESKSPDFEATTTGVVDTCFSQTKTAKAQQL